MKPRSSVQASRLERQGTPVLLKAALDPELQLLQCTADDAAKQIRVPQGVQQRFPCTKASGPPKTGRNRPKTLAFPSNTTIRSLPRTSLGWGDGTQAANLPEALLSNPEYHSVLLKFCGNSTNSARGFSEKTKEHDLQKARSRQPP